jgi:cell division protein FtsW
MGLGIVLVQAASPAVAERIGLDNFHFVQRHITTLVPTFLIMIAVSMMEISSVRRLALGLFLLSLVGVGLTLFVGMEIKGATRWLHIPGMAIQPSEFVKPAFAIVAAWLFAMQKGEHRMGHGGEPYYEASGGGKRFPGTLVSILVYGIVVALLLRQPDLGQTIVVSAIWFGQFFLAGMSLPVVASIGLLGVVGLIGAYLVFPHVTKRIDRFLDPDSGDNYHIDRSLEAFSSGGMFGTGPGQGSVKMSLPNAHADFIFAVAGEEFGFVFCIALIALFAFILFRGLVLAFREENYFTLLAICGLLIQFGLQAFINMGSTLHIIPAKGMTLPFISYGGSSMIALGFSMGMLLALTRKRVGKRIVKEVLA